MTDDFYSLAGVYHQYVFKYEKLRTYIQLLKSYSTKYLQEVEICQLLAADLLKTHKQIFLFGPHLDLYICLWIDCLVETNCGMLSLTLIASSFRPLKLIYFSKQVCLAHPLSS